MRLYFPNLTRPKKASKAISGKLGLSLSLAQRSVARISGYRDWHDLEQHHATHHASALDHQIQRSEFIERQSDLAIALAKEIGAADSDAQHALANCRLTGDRPASLSDQIEIRIRCWRRTVLPLAGRRSLGEVGRLKVAGDADELVILRSFDVPTTVISHKNVTTIADYEYVSPRKPLSMFIPMRLYLPYGYWVESDGAKVLFARDYTPMWRIRDGFEPERIAPWLWVKWREEHWLWDEGQQPWNVPALAQRMESLLSDFGIRTLPIWTDSLPLLLGDNSLRSFAHAIEPLKKLRLGQLGTSTAA